MDAEQFDAVPSQGGLAASGLDSTETHARVESADAAIESSSSFFSHALWSVFTAIPVVSSLAWLLLALRTRRARYLAAAVVYLVWPVVGFFFAALFIVIAGLESSTEHEVAFMSIVCGVMWLASLVNAHREWKALTRFDGDLFSDHNVLHENVEQTHVANTDPMSLTSVSTLDEAAPWVEGFFDREQPGPSAVTADAANNVGQRTEAALDESENDAGLYVLCYCLWLILGWVGAHRFYAGRWVSGLFYACTFGFAGAGWAVDLFLLNSMVDDLRRKERERRTEALRAGAASTHTAAWSESQSRFSWIDFTLRLGFYLVGPFVFTLLCVLCKHYELLAVMFVVVVICGLLGNIERALGHMAALEKVPLLGSALGVFRELYAYYSEHKPRPFLFYLFYPITAPLGASASAAVREELRLYWRMLRPVLLVIAAQQLLTYSSIYPPHLGPEDAFVRVFVLSFFAAVSTTMFLVPMITTSFALNLSGRQPQLKFLTMLCLAFALPTGIYCYYEQTQQISFLASDLLEDRMQKTGFRDELHQSAEMFLSYHVGRLADADATDIAEHDELTEKFRRHIGGITVEDEANGFVVFTVPGQDPEAGNVWLGVRLWYGFADEPSNVLFLMSPNQNLYTSWTDLPQEVQRHFRIYDGWEQNIEDASQRPEFIASGELIRDLY